MTSILDKIRTPEDPWYPRTPQDFFAIHLARALSDTDHLGRYIKLANTYQPSLLTRTFRAAARSEKDGIALADRFLSELRELSGEEENGR